MIPRKSLWLSYAALFAATILVTGRGGAEEKSGAFSFVHMSDTHVTPYLQMPSDAEIAKGRSFPEVQSVRALDKVLLEPYHLSAPKPSFVLHTGDVTEFGFPGATWDVVRKYFGTLGIPTMFAMGNHDNTWNSAPQKLRDMHTGLNYSFDYGAIHFAVVNSSTLQAPMPSIGEDTLQFLRSDFAKLPPNKPIMVALHHPLDTTEFCSHYDTDRLLDVLRDYNVVLILFGHGHSAVKANYGGFDAIEGGSTFGAKPGYSIVCVDGDKISAAYKAINEITATKPLIEKKIPAKSPYTRVTIESPRDLAQVLQPTLSVKASAEPKPTPYRQAVYEIDDETTGLLRLSGTTADGTVQLAGMRNGAHYLRVRFVDMQGGSAQKSTCFYVDVPDGKQPTARWRAKMGGGSKATPLVYKGRVFIGADDSVFYAFDEATGQVVWRIPAGGEVVSSAVASGDTVIFGTGAGTVLGVSLDGKPKWQCAAGSPVFSSPVLDKGGIVYVGSNAGKILAVKAETGEKVWENGDPAMCVESRPFISGDTVYVGSWDGNLYAIDRKSGKTKWKSLGARAQTEKPGLRTYYAPADNGPAATSATVFIADRGYGLGKYSMDGTFQGKIGDACAAIALSQDEQSLYLRETGKSLIKADFDGKPIWKASVASGSVPESPLERGDNVYICSSGGLLSALDTSNGEVRWDYQVSPRLYVMSGLSEDGGVVFTSGLDGVVTAVKK